MSRCAPDPFVQIFRSPSPALLRANSVRSSHPHLGLSPAGLLAMRREMVSHRPSREHSAKPGLSHRLTSRSSGRAKNMSWSRKKKQHPQRKNPKRGNVNAFNYSCCVRFQRAVVHSVLHKALLNDKLHYPACYSFTTLCFFF